MLATTASQGSCTARHQGGDVQLPPVQNMHPLVLPGGVEPWMLVQCEVPLVLKIGQGGVYSSIEFGFVLRFLHVSGDLEDRSRRLAEETAWAEQELARYAGLLNRLRRSLGMGGSWGLEETAQQPVATPNNVAPSNAAPPTGVVLPSNITPSSVVVPFPVPAMPLPLGSVAPPTPVVGWPRRP